MWDLIWYIAVISISTWFFLLSVLATIKFVTTLIIDKQTIKEQMNWLIFKYGVWWATTLIALVMG